MIRLTNESRILLAIAPADFRAGIDGLSARCRIVLEHDPRNGTIFIFINRAKTMIRALTYEGNGFWLATKRLSKGTFRHWPSTGTAVSPMSAPELMQLLQCEPLRQWPSRCVNDPPTTMSAIKPADQLAQGAR